MDTHEKELEILENIYISQDHVRQRDLSEIVGLSLGMTNAILNRLVKKGLLKISKVNNRNIRYMVSPDGIEAIMRRSYGFFKRTIKNVVYYRETIESFVRDTKKRGFSGIVLVGRSDLDFIVEHACRRSGVAYVTDDKKVVGNTYTLYSESYIPDGEEKQLHPEGDVAFLQEILMDHF